MTEKKPAKGMKLEIQLDDETAQGVYANLAVVNHTDAEFTLDFVFVQPQVPKAKVRSRIITSPRHAKRLLAALNDNIRKFEEKFGAIELGPRGEAPVPEIDSYH